MTALKKNKNPGLFFWFISASMLVLALVAAVWFGRASQSSSVKLSDFKDHQFVQIKVADKTYSVEVVVTPAAQARGLSGRDGIGSDGLLFLLPQKAKHAFWMKDMRFAIDIIWIDGNTVVDVSSPATVKECTDMQDRPRPCTDQEYPVFSPDQEADKVLEVPVYMAEKMGLDKGVVVEFVR